MVTSFGERWGWGSPRIAGLIFAAVALSALLVPVERHASAPILPPAMLRSRTVVLGSLIGFAANVAMFSVLIYLPTYLQVVHGVSATLSGVHLLPLVGGLVVTQTLAGRQTARPDRVRVILIAGMALNVVGLLLLATIGAGTSTLVLSAYFLVTGAGIGMVPMVVLTAVQNSVPAADIGAASAAVTFARSTGAAFGVAIFGTLLNVGLADRLHDAAHRGIHVPSGIDPTQTDTVDSLPPIARQAVLDAFAHATATGFLWITAFAIVGTLLAVFLTARPRQSN
jgi:predicted MFS family arabinose efflux permease